MLQRNAWKRRRSWLSQLENDPFKTLKLLRLPCKTRSGHIRPYPRVTFAPTSTLSRGTCDPTWGRGKCDPRAWEEEVLTHLWKTMGLRFSTALPIGWLENLEHLNGFESTQLVGPLGYTLTSLWETQKINHPQVIACFLWVGCYELSPVMSWYIVIVVYGNQGFSTYFSGWTLRSKVLVESWCKLAQNGCMVLHPYAAGTDSSPYLRRNHHALSGWMVGN